MRFNRYQIYFHIHQNSVGVFDNNKSVGIISNMKAIKLLNERVIIRENSFVEMVVWDIPKPAKGSDHFYKYSLALVVDQECVLHYDNEPGKGDHKHIGNTEIDYKFTTLEDMLEDFWNDVETLT